MNAQEIREKDRRVLVVNAMVDSGLAESFDRAIERPLLKAGVDFQLRSLASCDHLENEPPFSHLIISGSEASVLDERAEDLLLRKIVLHFVEGKKRVLGICYGHQFLAATLGGRQCCRKSANPEFGWQTIRTVDSPLFSSIKDPLCMVSHYDEVCDLDHRFTVIASTERCGIHCFQYLDLPVWGVQFHPEYNGVEAEEIFNMQLQQDPAISGYLALHPQTPTPEDLARNESILAGFCRL